MEFKILDGTLLKTPKSLYERLFRALSVASDGAWAELTPGEGETAAILRARLLSRSFHVGKKIKTRIENGKLYVQEKRDYSVLEISKGA